MHQECRHIKTSGEKCRAAALHKSHWCFFHERSRRKPRHQQSQTRIPTQDAGAIAVNSGQEHNPIPMPLIEDRSSVQIALSRILGSLAAGGLDPRRAGLLLYGLQIASQNTKKDLVPLTTVRTITYAADGSPLGPKFLAYSPEDFVSDEEYYSLLNGEAEEEDDEKQADA
ncbi:MAG: hypothetical protein ACR2JE_05960 [Acidobacteriaceae bacterium]